MLPHQTSPEFPAALKAARESKRMSRAQLARAAKIHQVMPRRYEDPNCRDFARPTANTWDALNRALGFDSTNEETSQPPEAEWKVLLSDASIDEIVAEIRKRGIAVTLSFPI